MTTDNIIIKPVISEKSLREAGSKRYTFLVKSGADKRIIREAIEGLFGVTVKRVFTNNIKKSRVISSRTGRKTKRILYKKARVIVGKDQKIDIFEEAVKEK